MFWCSSLPVIREVEVRPGTGHAQDSQTFGIMMGKGDMMIVSRTLDHGEVLADVKCDHEPAVSILQAQSVASPIWSIKHGADNNRCNIIVTSEACEHSIEVLQALMQDIPLKVPQLYKHLQECSGWLSDGQWPNACMDQLQVVGFL